MSWTPPVRSNEIYHGWLKRGARSSDHKYFQRIEDGVTKAGTPRYRYFYTKSEYDAYKMGSAQPQKQENGIKAKFDNAVDSVKKAFSREDNKYIVDKKNYKEKKKQIQETDEWKQITQDKNSEYRKKDKEGKVYYDYDQYLVDKKHPILDMLSDYGHGRKIEIRKQNADTFAAGLKDYAQMAKDTVEAVATASVGLLTLKIQNQQGSLEDEKKQFKKDLEKAKEAANTAIDIAYDVSDTAKEEAKKQNITADQTKKAVQEGIKIAEEASKNGASEDEVKQQVRTYIENNPNASAGIAAYAKERGITYYEAQEELLNAPLSAIKKYSAKAGR